MSRLRKDQRGNMPKRRTHHMPPVPGCHEETDEHTDDRDRETSSQEGPPAGGDEKLQQIDIAHLDIKELFKIARVYNIQNYTYTSPFSQMCQTCGKPWGSHYGDNCISWDNDSKRFKESKKFTEFFNSLRALVGKSQKS